MVHWFWVVPVLDRRITVCLGVFVFLAAVILCAAGRLRPSAGLGSDNPSCP